MSLLCAPDWLPELTGTTQAFIRCAYGVLLLGTLLRTLPHARRFFLSERWGGYAQSSPAVDRVQNPWIMPLVMTAWLASSVLLILGVQTVAAALVNLVLGHYFFIWMRWRGVLRGMGAPGFMSYWLAVAVFLLELTSQNAPGIRSFALLVVQFDFAFIMLSAGIYKWTAGYARNNGMEFGMVSPEWGYLHRFWRAWNPSHWIFQVLNQSAWFFEILAAVLMFFPTTRFLGASIIILSFVFIATQIRLLLLTEMVMVAGLLFATQGTYAQTWIDRIAWPGSDVAVTPLPAPMTTALGVAVAAYLALLPFAHAGMYWNLYSGKRLPALLQRTLDAYVNCLGIIIWRVFSADHTCFYPRIYRQGRDKPTERELLSHYARIGGRFTHVGECITLTSLFTTLKYYPSNSELFRERLFRYARTLPRLKGDLLIFEYVRIEKTPSTFVEVPVAEFVVDLEAGSLVEIPLVEDVTCMRSAKPGSPVRPASKPGTYAA
jgi:hypothetical protein